MLMCCVGRLIRCANWSTRSIRKHLLRLKICARCGAVFGEPEGPRMNPALASALFIFILRMLDIAVYTMRVAMVMRGRKAHAWMFGFIQAIVFVSAIRAVLIGLDNWL